MQRRIEAKTKAMGATPTPPKPWQRLSDRQVRLRDLERPANVQLDANGCAVNPARRARKAAKP